MTPLRPSKKYDIVMTKNFLRPKCLTGQVMQDNRAFNTCCYCDTINFTKTLILKTLMGKVMNTKV